MNRKEKPTISWQEKAAACIAGRIIKIVVLVSFRLQKVEQRMTIKQKKAGLFIFCGLSSIYLLCLLANALFYLPAVHPVYKSIPVPENARPSPDTCSSDKKINPFRHQ